MRQFYAMARLSPVAAAFLLLTGVVYTSSCVNAAEAPPTVALRGGAHSGFDRLVFDWPTAVTYKIKRDGTVVTVQFARAARFTENGMRWDKLRRITAPGMVEQGSGYRFSVAARASIKAFRSGTALVVDVSGSPAATTIQPSVVVPVAQVEEPIKGAMPPAAVVSQASSQNLAPLQLMPITSAASAVPNKSGEIPRARQALDDLDRARLREQAPPPLADSVVPVPAAGQPPQLLVQFNPGVPLALAAFIRGGYGYLIFERKLALDNKALISASQAALVLQPLNLDKATGWRFAMPRGADLRVDRNGNSWRIYIAGDRRQVPITLELQAEPNYPLGARLFLPVVSPPPVVSFTDPVIGDRLSVVPLLNPGDALSKSRLYADLSLLPTAQGLVVVHRNDALAVRQVPNGIEISADNGLRLSPAQDTGLATRTADVSRAGNQSTLFDFARWRGRAGETFTDARQRLMQNIVDVPEDERDRARIALARLYFAYGYAAEALALLNFVQERLPDLFARPEYSALHGAAQILANNPAAGLKDLAGPELKTAPERPLWEALALAQLRDYPAAAKQFNATIHLIDNYPTPIFARFASMALEAAVANGEVTKADQWLENWRLGKQHQEFMDSAAAHYLQGVAYYALKNSEQAAKHWRIAASGHDRLYRTRAEIALVDYDLGRGKLTAAAAAQRLEGLRFAWRGDALEWEVLRRLGLYYFQANKFRDGFVNLERARRLYPDMPGNEELAKKLSDTFHDLFTTDLGNQLSPLEALSLYQDYRGLVTDPAVARPIMQSLTGRLVQIDLLEQAALLLQDLMRNTSGEDKARIGARLAGISLLDKQPDKALAALTDSQTEGLSENLQQERQLLQARALIEQNHNNEAKAILQTRHDDTALQLLGDIAWRDGDWAEAARVLRQRLGVAGSETLSSDMAQLAVRAATALALAGDQAGLEQLAKDFNPAMRATPQYPVFAVLTESQDVQSLREIAARVGNDSAADSFRKFLERYRNASGAAREEKPTEPAAKAPVTPP